MLTLGRATIEKVTDFDPFVLPASVLLPGHDLKAMQGEAASLEPLHVDFEADNLLLSLHSFLLRVGGLTILIDSCVGEHKHRPRRADWHDRRETGYLERLARAGVAPEDVDVVMCTHLHADHVGWNTRLENGRWVPTFPRARYLVGEAELAHWLAEESAHPGTHNHGAFTDSVEPLLEAGLVERVSEGFSLGNGLNIFSCAGHSPGQIGLDLDGGSAGRARFCGDALHSPVHVFRPEWSTAFCHAPEEAASTRRALISEAAEGGTLLLPAHLRGSMAMTITRDGGSPSGYRPEYL
ncbi:MAG: MBL fold metallo-hydrolase [Vannielia sp.]|uniref:MBL fold metallo-hydrolase n=1 Tax=Vannielia sp. TaxID=2813045 RepID=UPI003B8ADF16